MATTDSRQAGLLIPVETDAGDPEKVARLFVSGLTGLEPEMVRRRWTPKPLPRPGLSEDWAAVGIVNEVSEGTPATKHRDRGIAIATGGSSEVSVFQRLEFSAAFYGPHAQQLADRFRIGAAVNQNQEWLKQFGLVLVSVREHARRQPDLFGAVWADRYDVDFVLGRQLRRAFKVRSISNADFEIYTERGKLE